MELTEFAELNRTIVCLPSGDRVTWYWEAGVPTFKPFVLRKHQEVFWRNHPETAPFPYVVVWFDPLRAISVAVRTDEQPLIWLWWWIWLRVKESARLISLLLLYLLEVWGLARFNRAAFPSWGDLWCQLRGGDRS